jgi:hypothetical protein
MNEAWSQHIAHTWQGEQQSSPTKKTNVPGTSRKNWAVKHHEPNMPPANV